MSTSADAMARTNGAVHDEHNIRGFFGDYRFLSNFHPCSIVHGFTYPSVENAYMAQKTLNEDIQLQFTDPNLSSKDAKRIGRTIPLRPDWEQVKFEVMYDLNWYKYNTHQDLKNLLLLTGYRYLEETNWWNDKIWGVCNGDGRNMLGKCLMRIRAELMYPL